jgi:hypothetical protein
MCLSGVDKFKNKPVSGLGDSKNEQKMIRSKCLG